MPEYRTVKREFLEDAVRLGVLPDLPPKLAIWWNRFQKPLEPSFPHSRLANRFSFEVELKLRPVGATGLWVGFAPLGCGFVGNKGADLVLRSTKGRSVLDVLAGLGCSGALAGQYWNFQLMGKIVVRFTDIPPLSPQVQITLGTLFGGKTLGTEVRLPALAFASPRAAFVTLTVLKLLLLRPDLAGHSGRNRLLMAFKGLDDDARLALQLKDPERDAVHSSMMNWGWRTSEKTPAPSDSSTYFPRYPAHSPADVLMLWRHLKDRRPLHWSRVEPTALPSGVAWLAWHLNYPALANVFSVGPGALLTNSPYEDVLSVPGSMRRHIPLLKKILGADYVGIANKEAVLVSMAWLERSSKNPRKLAKALLRLPGFYRYEDLDKRPVEKRPKTSWSTRIF